MKNNLEDLPLKINNLRYKNPKKLFSSLTNTVEVHYIIYNISKNKIIKMGSSKAICENNYKLGSIHAEEQAIKYCLKYDKKNKYKIFIWKWSNTGYLREKYCCYRCTLLINKYKMSNKFFTFNNNKVCSAVISNPNNSLFFLMNK